MDFLRKNIATYGSNLDAISVLRYGYLSAALSVLVVAFMPPLSNRFLRYGARASEVPLSSAEKEKQKEQRGKKDSRNVIVWILDLIADEEVPHDWFWTFYAVSLGLTAFWPGEAMWLKGPLYELVRDRTRALTTTMTFEQVKIVWIMMAVQGGRRLYESLTLVEWEEFGTDKKMSTMWAGHWVVGLAFYMATSVAFWIEGIPAIEVHQPAFHDIYFRSPSLRTTLSILLFILASGFQNDCHTYLAFLKREPTKAELASPPAANTRASNPTAGTAELSDEGKMVGNAGQGEYKLPTHPAFGVLICPHYTAECLIYLSLALVSAPQGQWINRTMACAMAFVIVNLGVTSEGTKRWYERRFGRQATRGKWRMIPPIF